MPSPFPGMDPYIEASGDWGDFHTSLLAAMRARLNAVLPSRYRAKIDVFVFVQEFGVRPRRRLEPDTYVVERPKYAKPSGSTATMAAPATIVLSMKPPRKRRSVLIVDRRLHRVITAVEVLSPANKEAGADRRAYLAKRNEYLGNRVSLVEIDLLRSGTRLSLGKLSSQSGDYYVMVCRAWDYPKADLWEFALRDPVPQIPIPLAPDLPDTMLPFRQCIDRAYDEGSYDTELDYDQPLTPRPRKGDAVWVRELLANRSTK